MGELNLSMEYYINSGKEIRIVREAQKSCSITKDICELKEKNDEFNSAVLEFDLSDEYEIVWIYLLGRLRHIRYQLHEALQG